MSSTTSFSAAATASSSTTCAVNLYDTPSHDANCAMPYGSNHTDIMAACCGSADVISYYDNCGLYCLAVGQSVQDLTDCLYAEGAAYQDVFCVGNTTATATGSVDVLPTSAQASVVAGTGTAAATTTSGATKTTSTSKSGATTDSSTSSSTASSSASSTASSSAAMGRPQANVGKLGLAIGTLLISATMFGALQI